MGSRTTERATTRARRLPPHERREALLDTTLGLIREGPKLPTTREIAEAAGVAEGTIFRAFATKDELFDAVLERTFDSAPLVDALQKVDGDAGLESVMIEIVRLLQARFVEIFDVMGAFSLMGPPERFRDPQVQRRQEREIGTLVHDLVQPYADELRLPIDQVTRMCRLLTFSGSHRHINDGQVLRAEDIVQMVLYGVVRRETH
ncbi:TetR/AcrR family transcriptional regulator [Flexivirga oryzae]|uniref:AcrR family transcriptional regulator n=1 Tax=Flexivirga oryzae TaxID=1794944 RepID=A0A839N8D1_9MICO|nr:TetR/AcrR family transcriptional regulator [Flexivirga oryzae]MBB2894030.1 AcrR family transcriptional regulator [Flexivirga oryzae]